MFVSAFEPLQVKFHIDYNESHLVEANTTQKETKQHKV